MGIIAGPETGTVSEKKKLDERQVKVLSYIEQLFWETGYLPTNEVVAERLREKPEYVQECYKNETFRTALLARGIDFAPDKSNGVLQPRQIMLANMLLNAHDKKSVREKLELAGVTSQQYHAWMRQPAFSGYLRKRAEEVFKSSDYDAYLGITKAAATGDVNALKFFFELRGIYSPKVQLDVNIEGVLAQVVEVIQMHVKDPQILLAIATDLESLLISTGVRRASTPANGNGNVPTLPAPVEPSSIIDVKPVPEISEKAGKLCLNSPSLIVNPEET